MDAVTATLSATSWAWRKYSSSLRNRKTLPAFPSYGRPCSQPLTVQAGRSEKHVQSPAEVPPAPFHVAQLSLLSPLTYFSSHCTCSQPPQNSQDTGTEIMKWPKQVPSSITGGRLELGSGDFCICSDLGPSLCHAPRLPQARWLRGTGTRPRLPSSGD